MQYVKRFWITFLAVLTVLATFTAVFYGVMWTREKANVTSASVGEQNDYDKALYGVADSLKNIDVALGKIAVSTNAEKQAKMLADVTVHANVVNQKLADLPIANGESLENAQKFVNQTQDYAKYLLGKIGANGGLNSDERKAVRNLDDVAKNFYENVEKVIDGRASEQSLGNFDGIGKSFDQMENDAFQYEKLIYDGPFSDSVNHKKVTSDGNLSHTQVAQKLSKTFKNVAYVCQIDNNGTFYCFDSDSGRIVTTTGGKVAEIDGNASFGETKLSREECITVAEGFCYELGYDVSGIWVSKTQEGVTYVNLAPKISDVIVYPDIVKVAVDSSNGNVVGLEARSYLTNHRERNVTFGGLSLDEAKNTLDSSLNVVSTAKALVLDGETEHICYQFECECAGRQYFVYVDSATGEEVDIFKVIEDTEGYTVM